MSLISLDLNNGRPNRGSSDTNWHLLGAGEGGVAPDWQPGSRQHRWLKDALEAARRDSAFTFVMFHHCPYSSGPHARPPGEWPEGDDLSGVPLRALTPLFMEYGVDVLLTGHDEMFEHSIVEGEQILADGESAPHRLHVFDVGVGGDGGADRPVVLVGGGDAEAGGSGVPFRGFGSVGLDALHAHAR